MKIIIQNARLAFPNVFQPRVETDEKTGKVSKKYGAALIIPTNHPVIKVLEAAFAKLANEKWGEKGPAILKGLKAQDRTCLHDGDTKSQYNGFAGNMFVSSTSVTRPSVFDRDKSPLAEEDGRPYSGCYVDASIELWPQDNKYGKRINAQLRGVRFVKDGDAFAAGAPASEDEFEDLADQGDDTDPTA